MRAESTLSLLPGWLQGLNRIKAVRAACGFATQFWFYGQIYGLGQRGATDPGLSVFSAYRFVEATHKRWLKTRRGG